MDPVLVTGGAGYIGSHTCKALAAAGFLPIALDHLLMGHAYAVRWGPLVQGDVADRRILDSAFQTFRPKAVLHFAADASVTESIAEPRKYYRNNLGGTIALLEAMQDFQVPYLVFSSTCAIYGDPTSLPLTEKHPQQPISPYGRSKWMAEQVIQDFGVAYGISAVLLRYFNAAGADLEGEIGEDHTPETHLIPSLIQAALGKREEIAIFGNDFPSRDGTAMRDYIHVQDLAEAHVKALQWLLATRKSETFNLGSEKSSSVLEVLNAVQKCASRPLKVRYEKRRTGDPSVLFADASKAKKLLGWSPRLSELPLIVESAWKWHRGCEKRS